MAKQQSKKITVNKNEEPAAVVEKIIDAKADTVILSVPRFAKLTESLANFHLIKREAEILKKEVIIESVDDKAIELANLAKLKAVNPFFVKSRKQFSDIVLGSSKKDEMASAQKRVMEKKRKMFTFTKPAQKMFPNSAPPSLKKILWTTGFGLVVLLGLFIAASVLPRADVKIIVQKHPFEFKDAITVDKLAIDVNADNLVIPGQFFTASKSISKKFPASGRRTIKQKARGTIYIYNAYSSQPQPLVATTRFLTPDGKLYRLIRGVTVPGAKVVDGKIVPSRIAAEVEADKPGQEFNIGPVSHFSIPGFRGSPKYNGFYGASEEPMTGGFIGEVSYPTDDDLNSAKTELIKTIKDDLKQELLSQIPDDLLIVDGTLKYSLEEPEVVVETDKNSGMFNLLIRGEVKVIAFKSNDIIDIMRTKIKNKFGNDFDIYDYDIQYGEGRVNFQRGIVSFPVTFSARTARRIDIQLLKDKIAGKSKNELKAVIFSIPGIENAQVSLWPFWVSSVPENKDKINITVD